MTRPTIVFNPDEPCLICGGCYFYKRSRNCIKCMRRHVSETLSAKLRETPILTTPLPSDKQVIKALLHHKVWYGEGAAKKREKRLVK